MGLIGLTLRPSPHAGVVAGGYPGKNKMKTIYEINSETNYLRVGCAPTIEQARAEIARHGKAGMSGASHSYTGKGGLTRSAEYVILDGEFSVDLSLKTADGELDYEAWDSLPRLERWQVGRMDNKEFVRRVE